MPLELELHDIEVLIDDSFRIWLRQPDDAYVSIDLLRGTASHARILDVLTEVFTESLSNVGTRGVVVVGTALNDEEPKDEE